MSNSFYNIGLVIAILFFSYLSIQCLVKLLGGYGANMKRDRFFLLLFDVVYVEKPTSSQKLNLVYCIIIYVAVAVAGVLALYNIKNS